MNKIVSCFTAKKVITNLKNYVKQFKKCLLSTKVSETLKIHIIIEHLEQCIDFLGNDYGLGIF